MNLTEIYGVSLLLFTIDVYIAEKINREKLNVPEFEFFPNNLKLTSLIDHTLIKKDAYRIIDGEYDSSSNYKLENYGIKKVKGGNVLEKAEIKKE